MKYVIDRLEGDMAVCENEGREMVSVPRKDLPSSAKEGDVVVLQDGQWVLDLEAAGERRERIRRKMMDLFE